MKRPNFLLCFIAVIMVYNSCKKDSPNIDCNSYPIPSDTYKYPILPGTPAWANLQTGQQRLQACQIPDSILSKISTEGLIQSWLDFPLNNEIFSSNSPQNAIEYFIINFSGLRELVKRNDVADKLYKRYQLLNPSCITIYPTGVEQGKFTFIFTYIKLALAQDTILNKMPLQHKKTLMREALGKYELLKKYSQYYDGFTIDLSLFICARTMVNCQYQPFLNQINNNLLWFINNALFPIPVGDYSVEKNIIISHALNFIN